MLFALHYSYPMQWLCVFIRLLRRGKSNLVIAWMRVKQLVQEHGDDVVKASLSRRQTRFLRV